MTDMTDTITLYHGTSDLYLDDILEHGLKCRGKKKSNWKGHPSAPDRVYLTSAYAVHFAQAACERGGKPLLLQVEVDTDRLVPDEDVLAQTDFEDMPELKGKSLKFKTSFWKKRTHELGHLAQWSLDRLGTVAHMGAIPAYDILNWLVLDDHHPVFGYHDPTITVLNYRILGEAYNQSLAEIVSSQGKSGHNPYDFLNSE